MEVQVENHSDLIRGYDSNATLGGSDAPFRTFHGEGGTTLEHNAYGRRFSLFIPCDATVYEFVSEVKAFMLMLGYHPNNIDECIDSEL